MSDFSVPARGASIPGQSPGNTIPAPASANLPTGTIAQPPNSLQNVAAGTIVQGQVTGRDIQGHVLIRTGHGVIALNTALALPAGSQVALQIRTLGTHVQVAILQVVPAPGEPVPAPARPAGSVAPADTTGRAGGNAGPDMAAAAAGPRPPPAPAVSMSAPQIVVGRFLAPEAPSPAGSTRAIAPAPNQEMHRPSATPLQTAPARPPDPPYTRPVAGTSVPPPANTAGPAPAGSVPPPAGQEAGRFYIRVVQAAQAGPGTQVNAGPDGAARGLTGTVLVGSGDPARHAGEGTLVQTSQGRLLLPGLPPLPPGTRLLLDFLGPVLSGPDSFNTGRALALYLGGDWPNLREALGALGNGDAVAGRFETGAVATPGPRLASALFFLMTALKGSDFSKWFGAGSARQLEQAGRSDILGRLGDDFGDMARLTRDAGPQDWRPALLPVQDGDTLQFIRLAHRETGGGATEGDGSESGFVLDLTLSALGRLQIKGQAAATRLALAITSEAPLPAWLRHDLHEMIAEAGAVTGLETGLRFRVQSPISDPFRAARRDDHLGLVI